MVILDAKGFAKELLTSLEFDGDCENIFLFDNINDDIPNCAYNRFPVIREWSDLAENFKLHSSEFLLGVGDHHARRDLSKRASLLGGKLSSFISKQSLVSSFDVIIKPGVCILSHATITADVSIGEGSLINKSVIISHDVSIGAYCNIAPGVKVLGRATVGDNTMVGANAVVLPGISVGSNCIIGSSAVVTKNIPDGQTVVGIPAKPLR